MGDTIVKRGLIRKRRELNRAIREHEAEVERLRHGAAIIDQVLLLWPEGDRSRQRGPSLSRCVMTALRLSGEPLGISEITRRVMTARDEAGPLADYRSRVRKALRGLLARGLVASIADGRRLMWEIVRQ